MKYYKPNICKNCEENSTKKKRNSWEHQENLDQNFQIKRLC